MDEKKNFVEIQTWPKESARLEHEFKGVSPCPVSIKFEEPPANVVIKTTPKEPFHVDMNMHVDVRDQLPVCIRLCEPICAKSDYAIGLDVFDRPVISITVRGMTRLFNCKEETRPELVCTSFKNLKKDTVFSATFSLESLTFQPIDGQLRIITFGLPAGQNKLGFPSAGVRIIFPYPVDYVQLVVGNYTATAIDFIAYSGDAVLSQTSESIHNDIKQVDINQPGTTAVVVKGGNNEANIVQVCYR
jgi:hypothetical protein